MDIRIGDVIRVKVKNFIHFFEVTGFSPDFVIVYPNNEIVQNENIIGIYRYKCGELVCVFQKPIRDQDTKRKSFDLLKVADLDKFSEWITAKGWKVVKTIGEYEVFRATSKKRKPIIFYLPKGEKGLRKHTHNGELYVTVMWQDFELVNEFYNNI